MADRISMLKKEINSILVSAGTEITLRQLEVDYRDLIGKPIPYRETGHASLEELILSMPDAVMTGWRNGDLKLCAITNTCNEHVAKLVSRSKNKPKTSYRPSKNSLLPRTCQQPLLSSSTTQNNVICNKTTNLTEAETNAGYSILRGEILNLMLGYRYGLPGSKFVEAFAKRYGDYKKLSDSGFPSILAMLQSMPDVVDIEFHENNSDFTVHGKLGRKNQNGNGTNLAHHERFPYKGNSLTNGCNEQKKNCDAADKIPVSFGKNVNGEKNQPTKMPYDDEESSENWNEEINEIVTEDLKTNIQKVLSLHPHGLFASKFVAEYRKVHGTKLLVKKLGYQTVMELVADMPEIAVIDRPANGDWLVFDKRTYRKELVSQVLQFKGQYFPPTPSLFDFRHSLRMVLETNPDGVQLKDLETIYENFIHQSINPCQLGFANLDRLLESVSDMVDIEYVGEGRVMVKLVRTPEKIQMIRNDHLSLAPFLPRAPGNLPKDVVLHGHIYVHQDPPMPSANYHGVLVSEVRDPGHFWFQLAKEKSILNKLMDNLQVFYQHPSRKNYAIPSEMMKAGLACVGQYPENQEWHRCVILDLRDEFAKVSYVDYGTEGFVCKKSLRFITWDFLSALPAQAIRGRLSKIAPVGKSWTKAAINCFFNLVLDQELAALITDVSEDVCTQETPNEQCVVSLCLCDTSSRDDIHINDHLIQEQHARLSIEELQEKDAVAGVEEDFGIAADKWIVCNDEDEDEYEFSSSESDMEPEVIIGLEPTAANASLPHADIVKGNTELELDERSLDLEQDFQQAWNDLQKERESALRQMNMLPGETACLVEQVEEIEEKMEMLKTHFEQSTNKSSASVLSFGSSNIPSVDRIVLQQGRSYLKQNGSTGSSVESFGRFSSASGLPQLMTNKETSHTASNSVHLPATLLPVLSAKASNQGVNLFSDSSASDLTSLSSSVHSIGNYCPPSPKHDSADALVSGMSSMSLGVIQTPAPGFATAVGFPGSTATSLTNLSGYQGSTNNGLFPNLPLILNSSILPGFNPLQYNPVLLGSMPFLAAAPCYIPGPYHANGFLPTPGLLPSLSIFTRLANGGDFPSGLTLPNTFVTGNQNLPNVSH